MSEGSRTFMINYTDQGNGIRTFSGRTDYLSRDYEKNTSTDVIEDPFFTSFSLVIDMNNSPLFKVLRDYTTYDDVGLSSEIEIALKSMHDVQGIVNKNYIQTVKSSDSAGGFKLGNGLQIELNIDEPIYGATEYIYMVDAETQPDSRDSSSSIANRSAYMASSTGNSRQLDSYQSATMRYFDAKVQDEIDYYNFVLEKYGENSVQYKAVSNPHYTDNKVIELRINQVKMDDVDKKLAELQKLLAKEKNKISSSTSIYLDNLNECNENINRCERDIETFSKKYEDEQKAFNDLKKKFDDIQKTIKDKWDEVEKVFNSNPNENGKKDYKKIESEVLNSLRKGMIEEKEVEPDEVFSVGDKGKEMECSYSLGSANIPNEIETDINKYAKSNATGIIESYRTLHSIMNASLTKISDTPNGYVVLKNIQVRQQELFEYTKKKEYYQSKIDDESAAIHVNIYRIEKDIEAYERRKDELMSSYESISASVVASTTSNQEDSKLISDGKTLKFGDTGEDVKKIQDALSILSDADTNEGKFGQETVDALKIFQDENGLPVTGVADPTTISMLNKIIEARGGIDESNNEEDENIKATNIEGSGAQASTDNESSSNAGTMTEPPDKTRVVIPRYLDGLAAIEPTETLVKPLTDDMTRVTPKCPRTVIDMLNFRRGMINLTREYPYVMQSITGLDEAYKNNFIVKDPYHGSGDGKISITCYESLDLRVSSMFNKYFNAAYDKQYRRERLPVNLRRFHCSVFVNDMRDFVLGNKILYNKYPVKNTLLDIASHSYSAVEFRFYDCEIVPEETGNIFDSVSNADLGDMKTTTFTFTYGNCIINFLSYSDLCNIYSGLKNAGAVYKDEGNPKDIVGAEGENINTNDIHKFESKQESMSGYKELEKEKEELKKVINNSEVVKKGVITDRDFKDSTSAIRADGTQIKDINGYTPLNWLNASVGFNKLGYEYLGNVNDDDYWEDTDWYDMASVQRRYSLRDTNASTQEAIDDAMRNHIYDEPVEKEVVSNLGFVYPNDLEDDEVGFIGDVLPDDESKDDINDLGNLGETVTGDDVDRLGSIDMNDEPVPGPTDMGDVIPDDGPKDVINNLGNLGETVTGDLIDELGLIDMNDKPILAPTDMGDVLPDDNLKNTVNGLGCIIMDDKAKGSPSYLGNINVFDEPSGEVNSLGSLDLNDVDISDIQTLMKI